MEVLEAIPEDGMDAVAQKILAELVAFSEGKHDRKAVVLALHGDLGAGKTTFTQALARALGVTEIVTSPTFVVMKKYETQHEVFSQLVHIDAYRIDDIDEMRPLRFSEELDQKETIICIEWAERIAELLPKDTMHITLTVADSARTISISYGHKN